MGHAQPRLTPPDQGLRPWGWRQPLFLYNPTHNSLVGARITARSSKALGMVTPAHELICHCDLAPSWAMAIDLRSCWLSLSLCLGAQRNPTKLTHGTNQHGAQPTDPN
jgi:hypothetical protein